MKKIARFLAAAVSIILLASFLASFFLPTTPSDPHLITSLRASIRHPAKQHHRLAILLPYAGSGVSSVPPYLPLFAAGAAGVANIVDFFIIHNGSLDNWHLKENFPDNIKCVSLKSDEGLARRLLRVLDHKAESEWKMDHDEMLRILTGFLKVHPYGLVEFKPALGYIFADYIPEDQYTHWGYSDMDILFGDLERWITKDEWTDYDIVTYGYGDQERLYLRGQWTFHKNTETTRTIWRTCDYLSSMDKRFHDIMKADAKYSVESAEGCYSAAVLERDDLSIKYAVKAWTDVDESNEAFSRNDVRVRGVNLEDTAYTHGLFFSRGAKLNKQVIYKARSPEEAHLISSLSPKWFEKADKLYAKGKEPLQKSVGSRVSIKYETDEKSRCMYWVPPKYQSKICLSTKVHANQTLYWIHGKLFQEEHQNVKLASPVLTIPFYHFQNWKRWFRSEQLAPLVFSDHVSAFVLAQEGVIPVDDGNFRTSHRGTESPLGLARMSTWIAIKDDDRKQLPLESYCLHSSGERMEATKCTYAVSWRDDSLVDILSPASSWTEVDPEDDVTLTLVIHLSGSLVTDKEAIEAAVATVIKNVLRWEGQPCVVLFCFSGATTQTVTFVQNALQDGLEWSSIGNGKALVGAIYEEEDILMSRQALLNMVIDAVPTRWFVSGLHLDRGAVLSSESALLSYRAARAHKSTRGNVFFIPQFAAEDVSTEISSFDLLQAVAKDEIVPEGSNICEDVTSYSFEVAQMAWTSLTASQYLEKTPALAEQRISQRRITVDKLEQEILELAEGLGQEGALSIDSAPVLLVDNRGPRPGMLTSRLAREIEELSGPYCYNAIRLLQLELLGYQMDIVPGMFSIATAVVLEDDDTLCSSCNMFPEDQAIVAIIVEHTLDRAAKSASLWTSTTVS